MAGPPRVHGRGAALLAEDDEGAVGMLEASAVDERRWHVETVYVRPARPAAGGRQGASARLRRARRGSSGVTHVSLGVLNTNEAAAAVWRRLGFVARRDRAGAAARGAPSPRPRRDARALARLDPRAERRRRLGRAGALALRPAARRRPRSATPRTAGSGSPTRCSTPTATRRRGSPASSPTRSARSSSRSPSRSVRSCASSSTSAGGWSTSTSRCPRSTASCRRATSSRSRRTRRSSLGSPAPTRDEVRRIARTAASPDELPAAPELYEQIAALMGLEP